MKIVQKCVVITYKTAYNSTVTDVTIAEID